MENTSNLGSRFWGILTESLKIFPILIILIITIYALSSSARQAIDGFILQTPARDLVASNYDNYPAFLEENDVIVKKAYFNDSGTQVEGLIIEIHRPAALAQTPTESMKPMFGPGNLLVQEKVDSSTTLNLGDIVIYENDKGELIIHQLISYDSGKGCYTTKGMNNAVADNVCVTNGMVKYRLLFSIPTR